MMIQQTAVRQMTYAEQGAEREATLLITQIEGALAAIGMRADLDVEALETAADRIERASRDFAVALRELAREHRLSQEGASY